MHPDVPIITNTMVATWITIVVLLIVTLMVRSRLTEVPGRFQGLIEVVLEFFLNLAESIAGRERARRFFPLVMTIFLFIVTANWIGILPGAGTIGWVEDTKHVAKHHADDAGNVDKASIEVQTFSGEGPVAFMLPGSLGNDVTIKEWEENPQEGKVAGILIPYFRGANTDINMTLSIAIIAMVMVHVWGFSALGFGHLGKYINFREGADWLLRGNPGRDFRNRPYHQLHVPPVRKHIRGRGAAGGDDLPDPADRHHPVPGTGAFRWDDPGVHLRHADAGVATAATTAHGGDHH